MNLPYFSRSVGLFLLALMAIIQQASATSRFWTGAVSGSLSNASNYSPAGTPVAGDDLVFQPNALVTRLIVTNDFSPNRAFTLVTFQGSNYFFRGNPLLITNGIQSINSTGPNTIDADVDVRASQVWQATGVLGVLDINGDINLNTNTLTVRANTGDFFFSGSVSGTGNLVKTNVGTLRMDGPGSNTYSGFMRFDGGVLELSKTGTAISGDLTIGDGNGLVGTDVLRLLADNQIADTSSVTVKNSGLFDLNDHDDRIGSLTMAGGTVDSGTGTLILGGNVTTLSESNIAVILGTLSLGGATRTLDIAGGTAAPDMRINATIIPGTTGFATAGIIKDGAGTLELTGTNTYNGLTTINQSQLAIASDKALGTIMTPLGGAAGTIINNDANLFLSNVQVTNESLTINAVNSGGDFNASGASIWTGGIVLNSDTFMSSSGSLLLSGQITGAGGFTKISTGSLTLSGTNANTYTGTTTVRDGTLFLDKDTSVVLDGAMSGPLVIGENELPKDADVVRYLHASQLPDDTDVTINASGLLDLNGFGENVRNIIFNGGDVDAPIPGSILPTGNITVNSNTNAQATLTGRMSVLSNPIIDVTGHYFSPDLSITAQLIGAGGFTKNGVGEVGLTASNSYTGTTTVNDGLLLVDDSFALGATNGGTVVNSGAVLALRFGVTVAGEALALTGTGQGSSGALDSSFGSNVWTGNVTLSAASTVSVDAGDFLNLSGAVTGGFNLTKTDTGILTFSGSSANSFNGLAVNGGTVVLNKSIVSAAGPTDITIGDGSGADILRLGNDNQIADTTPIHISLGGTFDVNDMNETTGSIDGVGVIDLGSGILRVGSDNASALFGGLIIGTGDLFKLGLGAWTLSANNTYSGQTTVSAGTFVVNGSQPASPVTVNGTATLMGSGTIGNLKVFGNLRPGASPGILTCSNLVFDPLGDFFVELNGNAPGTGYDQVKAKGSVILTNATLHATLGFSPLTNTTFTLIDNDLSDAVTNTFTGLAQGATVYVSGIPFQISYTGGSGNDVTLTQLLSVPNLNIQRSNANNVILSWATNYVGFTLESNTNLHTNVWTTVSPPPVVIGTNNVVTTASTGTNKNYRLRSP